MSESAGNRARSLHKLRINWGEVAVIVGGLATAAASATLAYVILALWALRGAKCALQALALSLLITMSNPALIEDVGNVLRWIVVLSAAGRILVDTLRYKKIPQSVGVLILFFLVAFMLSLSTSYEAVLSVIKLCVFTLGAAAVILGFHLTRHEYVYWKSWFFTLSFAVITLSLPTYFFDEIGRYQNGIGFQGILNHPQAYGVFLAPTLAWITGALLFKEVKRDGLLLFLVGTGWLLLVATLARTALLSVCLGLLVTVIAGALARRRDWASTLRSLFLRKRSVPVLVACLMALVMIGVNYQSSISQFLLKYDGYSRALERQGYSAGSIAGALYGSRQFMITRSFENFKEHPWMGIGFGLASEQERFSVERTNFMNIPVNASVEKGFLPTAVLEEVGILGALFFFVFVISLIRPVVSTGSLTALWLLLTCILINLGEMVIFSFGGIGLYTWLMIGFARIFPAR